MDQIYNSLTNIIKKYDRFILMTHKNPDFDGMGSCIAMCDTINNFKKECYIVVDDKKLDISLKKAFNILDQNNLNIKRISKLKSLKLLDDKTVVIIFDTHKEDIIEEKKLLDNSNIVLIDHHIKSSNYIKGNLFEYINSNLSSTVEFVCNYLRYLNRTINPIISTFLLIGLEIDTNNFKLKTTDKTYETAAFLTKTGIDNLLKQELLQESMDSYIKKSKLIEKSYMHNENTAICLTDNKIYRQQDLASIAENLLQFENVTSSYVIGKISSKIVGISARSIGNVNVEEVMRKLGGGGHLNEAATQINNKTIEQVLKELESVIE